MCSELPSISCVIWDSPHEGLGSTNSLHKSISMKPEKLVFLHKHIEWVANI